MSGVPKDPRQLILAVQAEAFYRMSRDLGMIGEPPSALADSRDQLMRAVAARTIGSFMGERRLGVAFLAVAGAWEREVFLGGA